MEIDSRHAIVRMEYCSKYDETDEVTRLNVTDKNEKFYAYIWL